MNHEVRKQPTTDIHETWRPRTLGAGLEQLSRFAREVQTLEAALAELDELSGESSSKAVARLRDQLAEFEPTITILGQVKAGKTALVNAMAGWPDLLPCDVNPWTSVVTSLHLKPGRERSENGACFRFMTEQEWDRLLNKGGRIGELASRTGAESEIKKIAEQIEMVREKARQRLGRKFELLIGQEHDYGYFDKNLLEKYICLGDEYFDEDAGKATAEQGRFADILRSADLSLNSTMVPCSLCLRDTPGVNDTFMMREQITVQAVRDSRLCVVVLSASQALTSVDMGLIRLISNLESRSIVIFVNRVDELSNPAQQVPEIEESIRTTLHKLEGPEDVEIVFGSAYWAGVVLSSDINKMAKSSAKSLFNWAEASLNAMTSESEPRAMVWELSGVPALYRALSKRIVSDIGTPFLKKIAGPAINIATSQEAAGRVRVTGESKSTLDPKEARTALDALERRHVAALRQSLQETVAEYQTRVDRSHAQFIDRATQSLIAHLEHEGPKIGWKYDPTGLRVLLRSAYSVFGGRAQAAATKHYETAVYDVARLYSQAFGSAVEGIQLAMPDKPRIPAPVMLGQTIALDFNDGWWVSWWKRLRGYATFAKQFRQLIASETEDFMVQLKTVQADDVTDRLVDALHQFFADQKDIFAEIETAASHGPGAEGLAGAPAGADHDKRMQAVLTTLRTYSGEEGDAT